MPVIPRISVFHCMDRKVIRFDTKMLQHRVNKCAHAHTHTHSHIYIYMYIDTSLCSRAGFSGHDSRREEDEKDGAVGQAS